MAETPHRLAETHKRDSARSKRLRYRLQKEYSAKDKEVKRSIRRDKRKWVDDIARNAATAGNMKTVYDATRTLSGTKQRTTDIIKDKKGLNLQK